jgi:hypothetical protein
MNPQFEPKEHSEAAIVVLVDAPNFEYVFGTDSLAIAFAFTAFQIDRRMDDAGLLFARSHRSAQIRSSRPPQRAA